MKLHPIVFALLAYGIAAVISFCVAIIIRIIARSVQRKKTTPQAPAGQGDKGGGAS
jgi:hypothetical protein